MTLCNLLHCMFSACNLRRKYHSVDVFKLSSVRLLIEELFPKHWRNPLGCHVVQILHFQSVFSNIVPKQCDLMSVGINLFLWWMSHFGTRLCKLFSEKIMNRHPTQGHENNPRKPGSLRSVMNQHYPTLSKWSSKLLGNKWEELKRLHPPHIPFCGENKHGSQVEQPEEFNKTRSSSAWCSNAVSK